MEENGTFLDYNPQYTNNNDGTLGGILANANYNQARNSNADYGVFARWLHPGIGEQAQFDRENFMLDKENAFNEYMFNKANEYNSPAAQMERMKEAGINPLLAASGIAGGGNATATPMQSAQGSAGQQASIQNPFSTIAQLISGLDSGIAGVQKLGDLLGFGKKNKAEIKLINKNADAAGASAGFTRQQTRQLRKIGDILVDNAKKEGQQISQNIEHLKALVEKTQAEKTNIEQDTTLKEAEVGAKLEETKRLQYENARLEFEKVFREMFGIELTHNQMAMLVEACLNGHGETIVKCFTDTIAGVLKGLKENVIGTPVKDAQQQFEDFVYKRKERKERSEKKARWERLKKLYYDPVRGKTYRDQYTFEEFMRKAYPHGGYSGKW